MIFCIRHCNVLFLFVENVLDDFQTNSELREKFPHAKKMMNKVSELKCVWCKKKRPDEWYFIKKKLTNMEKTALPLCYSTRPWANLLSAWKNTGGMNLSLRRLKQNKNLNLSSLHICNKNNWMFRLFLF